MDIVKKLDSEWRRLARSPEARRSLIKWSRNHPALAGMVDLADVLKARRDPALADGVLRALAEEAGRDLMATRTLLQALLPGLLRLAGTTGNDDPLAADELIALAWERIRTYPVGRDGSVAANVLLDVRKAYRRHRRIEAPGEWAELVADPPADGSPEEVAVNRALMEALRSAEDEGVVSHRALATIIRTRLHGERLADVADEHGVTERALGQQRWRAECRLRSFPLVG